MASQISDATASMVFFVKTKCKKKLFPKNKSGPIKSNMNFTVQKKILTCELTN